MVSQPVPPMVYYTTVSHTPLQFHTAPQSCLACIVESEDNLQNSPSPVC